MSDLNIRYRLAGERLEALRAEAARERMVRSVARAGRPGRTSVKATLGLFLIRAGKALGGEHRTTEIPAARASTRASLEEAGS